MFTLSPSSLSLFLDCPRCFWLVKVRKLSRPGGAFPSLPSGMDRVLKEHFDWHRRKRTKPEVLRTIPGRLYPDLERLETLRSARIGLRYTLTSGFTLMGALDDLLVTRQGSYAPIDFKTRGYPRKDDTHQHYQLQMDCYSLLLEKNDLPPTDFAILLFYHPIKISREHHVEFEADPVIIKTNPKQALEIMKSAAECLKGKEPKAGSKCGFCNWEGRI